MVTLIIGKKGAGKTKKLIELANAAVKKSDGNAPDWLTSTLTAWQAWKVCTVSSAVSVPATTM